MIGQYPVSGRFITSLLQFHSKFQFSTTCLCQAIPKKNKLPPRPKWLIKEEELEERFIKGGSGPGGQKINKSNSKVQLTHLPSGLVVECQYSRSQESNRKRAREIMSLKLDEMINGDNSRTAVLNERKTKVKQSKSKKANRKYKVLDEERRELKAKQMESGHGLHDGEVDPEHEFEQFLNSIKKE